VTISEFIVTLEACLPADLRGDGTTISKIAVGLSGAGVYRVDAAGRTYVMKVAREGEPLEPWRAKLHIQRLAADAGVTPPVIHVDEDRRVVLSAFVTDRSFFAFYGNPGTRDAAIALLGRTVRRIHDIPIPLGAGVLDPRQFVATIWEGPLAGFAVPTFVSDAVRRVLDEEPTPSDRAPVLSHNDFNPTNLIYDGEHLVLLDWDTPGPNDPYYDLATASLFLRMDEETCRKLLSAYGDASASGLPARFVYDRRVVGTLCGAAFMHLARQGGHGGATGAETLDSTLSLAEIYQQMRAGTLSIATADGQWAFGLALVKAGMTDPLPPT
jgi:aminoglycoside phosphotransferase (APT) family kinase protein